MSDNIADLVAKIEALEAENEAERIANAQLFDRAYAAEVERDRLAALLEVSTFTPWLREWCKAKFGKWITHNTAKGALNDLRAREALRGERP